MTSDPSAAAFFESVSITDRLYFLSPLLFSNWAVEIFKLIIGIKLESRQEKCRHAVFPYFRAGWNWLSSASDATARACHNLNKMVRCFSLFNPIHYLIGIYKSVGNSDL